MKIAITGGRGEMGHAVASLALERGHEVLTIDHVPPGPDGLRHANLTTETFDVTSYEMLEEAVKGSDALVHLAAFRSPGGRPPQQTHNTNVVASYNALTAASVLGITHVCQVDL